MKREIQQTVSGNVLEAYGMPENSRCELQLEAELHHAIGENKLMLHYQPQLDSKTGKIAGAEALIRWEHDILGTLAPERFIHLAEKSALIVELGNWVLTQTCSQLQRWRKSQFPDIRISANVSPRQLMHPNFLQFVSDLITTYELRQGSLTLELTESCIIEDSEKTIMLLTELRRMGIEISIDDFGTGYSSLSYLSRLPVDELKVDGSMIRDISENSASLMVVQSIISLAKSMRLRVIAECVETESQQNLLTRLGCNDIQGHLISKALTVSDFEKFIFS